MIFGLLEIPKISLKVVALILRTHLNFDEFPWVEAHRHDIDNKPLQILKQTDQ